MASATIVLCLTHTEAQALADILARVGGPSATTRRTHADSMLSALRNAGVDDSDLNDFDPKRNGIFFK